MADFLFLEALSIRLFCATCDLKDLNLVCVMACSEIDSGIQTSRNNLPKPENNIRNHENSLFMLQIENKWRKKNTQHPN